MNKTKWDKIPEIKIKNPLDNEQVMNYKEKLSAVLGKEGKDLKFVGIRLEFLTTDGTVAEQGYRAKGFEREDYE